MASDTNSSKPTLVSLTDTDFELFRMLYALLEHSQDPVVVDLRLGLLDLVNRCDLAYFRQFGDKQ